MCLFNPCLEYRHSREYVFIIQPCPPFVKRSHKQNFKSTIIFLKVQIKINGLVQDCSNPRALAMELLQFSANISKCSCLNNSAKLTVR